MWSYNFQRLLVILKATIGYIIFVKDFTQYRKIAVRLSIVYLCRKSLTEGPLILLVGQTYVNGNDAQGSVEDAAPFARCGQRRRLPANSWNSLFTVTCMYKFKFNSN